MDDIRARRLRVGRVLVRALGPFIALPLAAQLTEMLRMDAAEPRVLVLAVLERRRIPGAGALSQQVVDAWRGVGPRTRRETRMLELTC